MNAGDIIDTCRRDILDDPNEPYLWSDSFMLSALDRAQREACNRQDLIFDATTASYGTPAAPLCQIPLVSNQQAYVIAPIWNQIENLIVDGIPLVKRSMEEMDRRNARTWRTTVGPVSEYVQRGFTVYLVQIPGVALTGESMTVEGWRMPLVTLNDMDLVPEIPPEFHDHLKWWAAYEAYNKRDAETYNPQRALECLANFERIFGQPVSAGVRMHQFNEPRISCQRPVDYLPSRRARRWPARDRDC